MSNTMDVGFCLEALDEAMAGDATPEIFNTDQSSQFTSLAFTEKLKNAAIKVSMDGRGRWIYYYNPDRPHSSHNGLTPNEVYETSWKDQKLAA